MLKVLIITVFSLFFASCGRDASTEPVPAKTSRPIKFHIEHVATVGEDTLELGSPTSMARHPQGMLILDYQLKKAFCLSDNLEIRFEFGREGNGPGEFQRPLKICVSDEHIFVYDLGKFSWLQFDLKGNFQKEIKLSRPCAGMFFANNQYYYNYFHKEGLPDIEVRDKEHKVLHSISLKNADQKTVYATVALDKKGLLYAAPFNKYDIEVYDPNGKFLRRFGRPYDEPEYVHFPPGNMDITLVPVSGLAFSGEHVLVLHGGHQIEYEKLAGKVPVDPKYHMRIDVYDGNGKFVAFFWDNKLPNKMNDVHKAFVFNAWDDHLWIQDPEDFRLIHQYRIISEN